MENFYIVIESDILSNKYLNSTDKVLYALICFYSNNKNGYCFKTYKQLSDDMNISLRQLYRCINNLCEYNYILIKKSKDRNYIMPVVNHFYIEAQKSREKIINDLDEKSKNFYNYDWLNEND